MARLLTLCVLFALLAETFLHSAAVHSANIYKERSSHNLEYDAATKFPFQDPTLPWSTRIDDLVARITLDEIAAQTLAFHEANPPIPCLSIKPYVWRTECLHG